MVLSSGQETINTTILVALFFEKSQYFQIISLGKVPEDCTIRQVKQSDENTIE
jgi:hypothetical protein